MKRGHIITCESEEDYQIFIRDGYAGLYPISVAEDNEDSSRALAAKLGTNWDIIADLKRVKPNDYVFLHVKGNAKIYGPFLTTSHFKESPLIDDVFKSSNLHIDYWEDNYDTPQYNEYHPWRVGIKSIEGVTKSLGFNSMELFKLKSVGQIQSIPERFFYHDKPKIVKPLLNHETQIILDKLNSLTPGESLNVNSNSLANFNAINLHLKPYNGELYREKILEAWLMENITNNGNNELQYNNLRAMFGNATHFVNSIFTYYTNFMDVLFYSESNEPENEYCTECKKYTSKNKINIATIELKKGFVDISTIFQLREYGDWTLRSLANNDRDKMKLFAIGSEFADNALECTDVICVKYTLLDAEPFLKIDIVNSN